MTEIEGIVREVRDGMLAVEVRPQIGCGRCQEPGGCGGNVLTTGDRVRNYRLPNTIGAVVGERVLLGVDDGAILRGAMTVYGIPGASLIVGAALGAAIRGGDVAAMTGAVLGLMFGAAALYLLKDRVHRGAVPRLRHSERHFDCEGKS
ncbi:MAG: SoxR reducing system RseC family protein [Rhodocyclaceae bacterium]|jgi:sigma-E factor negative regulatory protein RseC|nr:SoxR reducing system RseC family protein [Rhodocyclaceae bacterium]